MKRIFGLFLVVAIAVSVVPYARSLGNPSPPSGVSASDWIPFGDSAGFVITHDNPLPGATRSTPGMVRGYFMVRHTNIWLRVDSAAPYDVQKAMMVR
jgi:hypothetical protein